MPSSSFAGGIAIVVTLLGTPLLIRLLQKHGYSQAIRMSTDDIQYPEHTGRVGHRPWRGRDDHRHRPGLRDHPRGVLVMAVGVGLLALWLVLGLGAVGFADDYLKIFRQRSTGIRARTS